MSIEIEIINYTDGIIGIEVPSELVKEFKDLISRGLNTWDTASPGIKIFGDLLIHGKVLQDYEAQVVS